MQIKSSLLLSCVLVATAGAASAQAPPTASPPPAQAASPSPDRASGCAPTQTTPRGNVTTEGQVTTGQSQEPLGDKLAKSDGVLCPPSGVQPPRRAPAANERQHPGDPPPARPR